MAAWTVTMEYLIMAMECALSVNSGNSALIVTGGIAAPGC